jgi:predicted transglutaminase-like cysteine proteinase
MLCDYTPLDQQIIDLTNRNSAKDVKISTLSKQLADSQSLLITTQNQDKKTISQLQAQLAPDPNEVYWNNRYPKINQNYLRWEAINGQPMSYEIDVRNFIVPQDSNLPAITGSVNDEKALNSLLYVYNNITYTSDKSSYGFDEYWAFPWETLKRKVGDCEDGAILMASIMIRAGIPPWRVRLNAGSVNGGGHCYVTYCRETDNQFVVLDWCYWFNNLPVAKRKLHKDEQNYDDVNHNYYIWFSWNQKYCFGQMQTMANMPEYLSGVN